MTREVGGPRDTQIVSILFFALPRVVRGINLSATLKVQCVTFAMINDFYIGMALMYWS